MLISLSCSSPIFKNKHYSKLEAGGGVTFGKSDEISAHFTPDFIDPGSDEPTSTFARFPTGPDSKNKCPNTSVVAVRAPHRHEDVDSSLESGDRDEKCRAKLKNLRVQPQTKL